MNKIIIGDCLKILPTLASNSVDCCVTSPPYWGLRNYQVDGQLGLEKTPEEYVDKLVVVFAEVKRVLKKEGTCWLNLGDSYAGSSMTGGTNSFQSTNTMFAEKPKELPSGLKPKDLCGIPWRVAFALQADGWWLRQDIIWAKPNPMPESVTDRCTKSHEYIFLLTKSTKYYFDYKAIQEDSVDAESYKGRRFRGKVAVFASGCVPGVDGNTIHSGGNQILGKKYEKRNKRSVWTVTVNKPKICKGHFAVFPEKLILPCVLAGCPAGGIVLDPFAGVGTTAVVAVVNSRQYIGIELNKKDVFTANRRIAEAKRRLTAALAGQPQCSKNTPGCPRIDKLQ